MRDHISIENLEIFANHGVLDAEVVLGQKFIISVDMFFDSSLAGITDDLTNTINYAEVCDFLSEYVRKNTFKLIETIAENVARELLLRYDMLDEVSVTVKKPWAPIGHPLENVLITISRKWHKVYLSIGSNMGDKRAHLDYAVNTLKSDKCMKDVRCSEYIVTEPYGGVEQDDFLNAAVALKTIRTPREVLNMVHNIENDRNRTRQIHWGPRTLDVDILMYDDCIVYEEDLVIPHPDMTNRLFVLGPLDEIAPYAIHPVKKMTVRELKNSLLKVQNS